MLIMRNSERVYHIPARGPKSIELSRKSRNLRKPSAGKEFGGCSLGRAAARRGKFLTWEGRARI